MNTQIADTPPPRPIVYSKLTGYSHPYTSPKPTIPTPTLLRKPSVRNTIVI